MGVDTVPGNPDLRNNTLLVVTSNLETITIFKKENKGRLPNLKNIEF